MNKFDCNKCTHQNVCRYKEQVPEFDSKEGSDSVFELALTCKEYREMVAIPRQSDIPVVVPFERSWPGVSSGIALLNKETECQAYKDYLARAKDLNSICDSPCSYCLKTDCPRSHVVNCINDKGEK